MGEEFKRYDTNSDSEYRYVRAIKDAQTIREGFVKVTIACDSKLDADDTMFIDCVPIDAHLELASKLKKGDVFCVSGFLTMHRYEGKDGPDVGFTLRRARFHYPPSFIAELRSRDGGGSKAPAKGKGGKAPAKPRREIVDLGDDEGGAA